MKAIVSLITCLAALQANAAITVKDDDGNPVTVQKPAQRIVALAPHVTELLFAAGGGERIVGTVSYSDYPEAAKRIVQVGDSRQLDMERLIALKPDLIVVWMHGSSERQIDSLRKLGIPLFHSEPRKLDDIADNLLRLGQLMGTEKVSQPAAAQLRAALATLRKDYAKRSPVRVFYQVWHQPIYTLNGAHILSDAIQLCGGQNVFATLPTTAPVVSVEGVLQQDPEAIIGTTPTSQADQGVAVWKQYTTMKAVRNGNLFTVDGDLLNRAGPRMIAGAAALCEKIELARRHRKD